MRLALTTSALLIVLTAGGTSAATPVTVDGVTCSDAIRLTEAGHLRSCVLARDTGFGGLALPSGATVHFDRQMRPVQAFLNRDAMVGGHLLRGRGHDYQTTFFPDGRLRFANLA